MALIQKYINELIEAVALLPQESINKAIRILKKAQINQNQIFIMGNGGSASTASHFVCDLSKNTKRSDLPHFRVVGLTDNMASFSAYGNDEGYGNVFVKQLENLLNANDVVIGISTSGNSENVIKAVEYANMKEAITIGFTGKDGGRLGSLVKLNIYAPTNCIEQVEDIHLILEHMMCTALRDT